MKRIVYIFTLLFIVLSCKKDEVSEVFTTDLELIVTNQFSVPYANTNVFLYDNKEDFIKVTNGEVIPYISVQNTNTDGKVTFVGLDENKKYYFYVKSGNKTNENTDFTLKNNLIKGAVTTAVVILESTDSYLVFWTQEGNKNNLPADIYINNTLVRKLTDGRGTAPTQGDLMDAVQISVDPTQEGKPLKYKVVGKSGCYWEGTHDVTRGAFIIEELKSCNTGSIVFYKTGREDVKVTLSQIDEVGTITTLTELHKNPTCENPEGGIVVERPAGTYIYKAVSESCFWSGTVTVTSGGCQKVKLEDCK